MKVAASLLLVILVIFVLSETDKTEGLRRVRHKPREHCLLIPDSGPCTSTLRRWYYNSETGECRTFIWSGCDGNDNRFRSRRQCERRCKERGSVSDEDRMSTYFRAVSRSGRRCPRLRCGEHGSSCPPGTSPVFSTDEAGCPICTCRQLSAFLRRSTTCPPLDCRHLVCEGPVRFSSRLVGHCPVCECVAIDETGESKGSITYPTCPRLVCSDNLRCRDGRKRDPMTGCETCECANEDSCSNCAEVCASSESSRCALMCGCNVAGGSSCRPAPADCDERAGCLREIDAAGCEVCRCSASRDKSHSASSIPICRQLSCSLICADSGYAVDQNGCRVCACADSGKATSTMPATILTSCVTTDCRSQCPGESRVVKDDDGCDLCICTAPETVTGNDDDITKPPCTCKPTNCSRGGSCESCSCSTTPVDLQSEASDETVTVKPLECKPLTQDKCDANCVLATDDVGCHFCLCTHSRKPETETETSEIDKRTMTDGMKTMIYDEYGDETTTKNLNVACDDTFVCHPICQMIKDDRGCVVECRCDEIISSLTEMQRQQQNEPDVEDEPGRHVTCSTTDALCTCDVDAVERWTVDVDGCSTCVCTKPFTTTTAQPSSTSSVSTTTTTTTTTTTVTTMSLTSEQDRSTAPSSTNSVECRPLADGDCSNVNCGDAGYEKDENGCEICSCANVIKKQPVVNHVVAAARRGACSLSPLRGPCRASLVRWYYDVTSGTCDTFSYGGCRGNANNFRSSTSCLHYCRPHVDEEQRQSRIVYQRLLGLLRRR